MGERRGETFVMSDSRDSGTSPDGAISFTTFILGLASTTLIHLGEAPNPETGAASVQLDLARQSLELLDLLRAKTRGNLSEEEERLFTSLLTDLRLRFVEQNEKQRPR